MAEKKHDTSKPKKTEVAEEPKKKSTSESTKEESAENSQMAKLMKSPMVTAGIVAIVILAIAGYLIGKWMIVADVNGEKVNRMEYYEELEKTNGKQVLEGMATKKLIIQAAEKKNIQVTDAEIQTEIGKIDKQLKAQGQSLDQVLSFQGMNQDILKDQIRIQKMVEKLVGNNVQVTDAEVDKYIEDNPDLASSQVDIATLKAQAKDQLLKQKTDQKIQQLVQDLRKNAKIQYYNE